MAWAGRGPARGWAWSTWDSNAVPFRAPALGGPSAQPQPEASFDASLRPERLPTRAFHQVPRARSLQAGWETRWDLGHFYKRPSSRLLKWWHPCISTSMYVTSRHSASSAVVGVV